MFSQKCWGRFCFIMFFVLYMAMVWYMRFEYESELMKQGRKDIHYWFYDQPYVPPTSAPPTPKKNQELEHYYKVLAFYKRQGRGKRRNLNTNYVRPGRMPQPARHLEAAIRLQYMSQNTEWPVYGDGHQIQKPNFIWTSIFVLISNLPRLVGFNNIYA